MCVCSQHDTKWACVTSEEVGGEDPSCRPSPKSRLRDCSIAGRAAVGGLTDFFVFLGWMGSVPGSGGAGGMADTTGPPVVGRPLEDREEGQQKNSSRIVLWKCRKIIPAPFFLFFCILRGKTKSLASCTLLSTKRSFYPEWKVRVVSRKFVLFVSITIESWTCLQDLCSWMTCDVSQVKTQTILMRSTHSKPGTLLMSIFNIYKAKWSVCTETRWEETWYAMQPCMCTCTTPSSRSKKKTACTYHGWRSWGDVVEIKSRNAWNVGTAADCPSTSVASNGWNKFCQSLVGSSTLVRLGKDALIPALASEALTGTSTSALVTLSSEELDETAAPMCPSPPRWWDMEFGFRLLVNFGG